MDLSFPPVGVNDVAHHGGRRAGTASVQAVDLLSGIGVSPNDIAGLRIESTHVLLAVGVTHDIHGVANDGWSRVTDADLGPPRDLRLGLQSGW